MVSQRSKSAGNKCGVETEKNRTIQHRKYNIKTSLVYAAKYGCSTTPL